MPTTSLRSAIDAKCRDCIFDRLSAGTWREQVASCVSANCSLHPVRPMPRAVMRGGNVDPEALKALQDRLEAADRKTSAR